MLQQYSYEWNITKMYDEVANVIILRQTYVSNVLWTLMERTVL